MESKEITIKAKIYFLTFQGHSHGTQKLIVLGKTGARNTISTNFFCVSIIEV